MQGDLFEAKTIKKESIPNLRICNFLRSEVSEGIASYPGPSRGPGTRLGHELIENHNSLGRDRPSGLYVKQSPNVQDTFQPIPGLISCAG